MKHLVAALVLLAIAACAGQTAAAPAAQSPPPPAASSPAPEPAAAGDDATCHSERYQSLVGQSREALAAAHLPAQTRVICFGCMATMDFIGNRLTIQMGPGNRVASVRCG